MLQLSHYRIVFPQKKHEKKKKYRLCKTTGSDELLFVCCLVSPRLCIFLAFSDNLLSFLSKFFYSVCFYYPYHPQVNMSWEKSFLFSGS